VEAMTEKVQFMTTETKHSQFERAVMLLRLAVVHEFITDDYDWMLNAKALLNEIDG